MQSATPMLHHLHALPDGPLSISPPSRMQGVGNFVNTAVLLILLAIFGVTTVADQKRKPNDLGGVWRTAFGLGLIVFIIYYRVVYLKVCASAFCLLWSACMLQQSLLGCRYDADAKLQPPGHGFFS